MIKKIPILFFTFLFLAGACRQSRPLPKNDQSGSNKPKPALNQIDSSKKPRSDSITYKIIDNLKIDSLADSTLWDNYYKVRDKSKQALQEKNYNQATNLLLKAARYTHSLNRDDITAWQYNNAGYCRIQLFIQKTDYNTRINKINNLPNEYAGKEYIQQTKDIFAQNLEIIKQARLYLEKAYELDQHYSASQRTQKIYNNLKFADWICNYVKE